MRRNAMIPATILLACTVILNVHALISNPSITGTLEIHVAFDGDAGKDITPVWRAMNVWDIDIIDSWIDRGYTQADYHRDNPSIDTLVLMTATGGRSTGSNEHVFRHANGTIWYDFSNLTTAIDWIVSGGFHLELVIGNTPRVLASETSDYGAFDALTAPPANYTEYRWFVANLTTHCLDTWGLANVSAWEFRLMTEPDNRDWWSADADEYVKLWMATFGELKARVPDASLVLGNVAWHDKFDFAGHVLQEIHRMNTSLLPDTVSFSYYHFLKHPPRPDHLAALLAGWTEFLEGLNLGKSFMLSGEEGQILADENGMRLWNGDGTELGGAWQAWMISSCIPHPVSRFVQWSVGHDRILAPKGFVQLAGDRMRGFKLVPTRVGYHPLYSDRVVNAFAGKNASDERYALLLHQYIPRRAATTHVRVGIAVNGIPDGAYHVSIFRIDRHNHNFFPRFLEDSAHLPRVPGTSDGGGSMHDLAIGVTLGYPEGWSFWYNWQLEHESSFQPLLVANDTISRIVTGGRTSLDLDLRGNDVVLVELVAV